MTARELEIIAHRGYSALAPENTLIAVKRAIAAGADAVEWDIHVAACGTPVLIHDEDVARTTDGAGLVRDHTLADLRRLDAGRWFGAQFQNERIPSLSDALALASGRMRRVYTEIKGYRDTADLDRILGIVQAAGTPGHVFISLDWSALEHIARRDRTAAIGYVVETHARLYQALERASGDERALLDIDYRLILERPTRAESALTRAREQHIPLAVWTVNETDEADRLRDVGITRFTTNQVERLVTWRETAA